MSSVQTKLWMLTVWRGNTESSLLVDLKVVMFQVKCAPCAVDGTDVLVLNASQIKRAPSGGVRHVLAPVKPAGKVPALDLICVLPHADSPKEETRSTSPHCPKPDESEEPLGTAMVTGAKGQSQRTTIYEPQGPQKSLLCFFT